MQQQVDHVPGEWVFAAGLIVGPEGKVGERAALQRAKEFDGSRGRSDDRAGEKRIVVKMERAGHAPAERSNGHQDEYDVVTGKDNVSVTKIAMKGKPVKPKTAGERRARLARILAILDKTYPNATCALVHHNAWELLVATILSAQCTDKRVNEVTPGLFRKYPTIEDIAHASPAELENEIRSTGFFRNKTKSLIGAARTILGEFGGKVPRTIEELTTVPGAARKTANVVLGTAYGIASGVVVDTHVQRVSRRLDLTKESEPVKIEKDLMKMILPERWILFSHQIIHHGRRLCIARKPKCSICPLDALCYASDKTVGG